MNNNIINFNEKVEEINKKKGIRSFEMPTKWQIDMLNKIVSDIPEDEMVDIHLWNGNCWRTAFEKLCIPHANDNDLDPWDVLAVVIMQMNGAVFTKTDDGTVRLQYE